MSHISKQKHKKGKKLNTKTYYSAQQTSLLACTSIQGFWPLCSLRSNWFQTTKPNSKATARAQL